MHTDTDFAPRVYTYLWMLSLDDLGLHNCNSHADDDTNV
jgi:hypothetical protein